MSEKKITGKEKNEARLASCNNVRTVSSVFLSGIIVLYHFTCSLPFFVNLLRDFTSEFHHTVILRARGLQDWECKNFIRIPACLDWFIIKEILFQDNFETLAFQIRNYLNLSFNFQCNLCYFNNLLFPQSIFVPVGVVTDRTHNWHQYDNLGDICHHVIGLRTRFYNRSRRYKSCSEGCYGPLVFVILKFIFQTCPVF